MTVKILMIERISEEVGLGIMLDARDARYVPALGWRIGGVWGFRGGVFRQSAAVSTPRRGAGAREEQGQTGKTPQTRTGPCPHALWGYSPYLHRVPSYV